jgi:arsenite/tail-anchored protein-transporting ATPase
MKTESRNINLFFLGKGGVGKSTASALLAVYLADKGKNVMLVSMDPAHNQSDIFETSLSEKPYHITKNLTVKETDLNYWIKKYLSEVEAQIKHSYSYLTALNLENYLDIIKFSPGIEEYALLLAYKGIRKEYSEKDYIVFDMPPTALTLKFFGLPKLSMLWIEKLLDLRNEIIKKREIITKVKIGTKEIERDKILNKLNEQIKEYDLVGKELKDSSKTKITLVMNNDKLSFSESELIVKKLNMFNLFISSTIINKVLHDFSIEEIQKRFDNIPVNTFPFSETPLIGLQSLRNYLMSCVSLQGIKI